METRLLRPSQAARLAGQTPETIRRWCRDGVLEAAQIRGRWLIDPAALNDLLHVSDPAEGQKITLLGGAVLTGHLVDERDGNLVLTSPPHWLETLVPLDIVVEVA